MRTLSSMAQLGLAWLVLTGTPGQAAAPVAAAHGMSDLKTYSAMGKEQEVLVVGRETEIFRRAGRGCLTHMWFAVDERVRVRVYVDDEPKASIDMALDLGHGYAFGGPPEPFGNARMGRYGGQFNNYQIPYDKGIRVALFPMAKTLDSPLGAKAWWILRGTDNLPLVVAGRAMPAGARLKLFTLEPYNAKPLEEFALCDVKGAGLLYEVTLSAVGGRQFPDESNLSYMEGCMRAYLDGATSPEFLSSGLEDYFLGSGYFHQNQRYYGAVAGLTHIDKRNNAFSAYRFHDEDPVFFQQGLRLTCRCGELLNGKPIGEPRATEYRTYTWVYLW